MTTSVFGCNFELERVDLCSGPLKASPFGIVEGREKILTVTDEVLKELAEAVPGSGLRSP